jgi:hypothetical protein
MKRKIRVSRKKRVRGGGKEEDLLRVIGAPNPHVNEILEVEFDGKNPMNSVDPKTMYDQFSGISSIYRISGLYSFITTFGTAENNVSPLDFTTVHSEGYRLPNSFLLYMFKNTFLWSMCKTKSPSKDHDELISITDNIIMKSNIIRTFGTLYMRFKILEEIQNKARIHNKSFDPVNIPEINEIQYLVYLFVNLILAVTIKKFNEWGQNVDKILVMEIQKLSLVQFNVLFSKVNDGKTEDGYQKLPITTSTFVKAHDPILLRVYLGIHTYGCIFIKNLFDRAITKLYTVGESLLGNKSRVYNEDEFASVFNKQYPRIGNDTLELELPVLPDRDDGAAHSAASMNSQKPEGGTRRTRRIRRTRSSRV